VVELLLARGADVNARDNSGASPLENASRYRHAAVVDLLMAHGATLAKKDQARLYAAG
jgi:ankyrin repeat protein